MFEALAHSYVGRRNLWIGKLQRDIERALRKAERERNERKKQLLAEILGMVPNQDKAR